MRILLVFVSTLLFALPALAQPVDGGHARVELIAERDGVVPGETIHAGLRLVMDPGWHVYWRNAGDAGLPPQLIVKDNSDIPAEGVGDFIWPIPDLLPVVEGEIMDYGYSDEVVLPFAVTIPEVANDRVTLEVVADYLICENICVPEQAEVSLALEVGAPEPNEAVGRELADWSLKAPMPFEGDARIETGDGQWKLSLKPDAAFEATAIRFFPFGHEISHPADQPLSTGPQGATLTLTPSGEETPSGSLDGVIIVTDATGARAGYELSAEVGPVFDGTYGMAVTAPAPAGGSMNLALMIGLALLGGMVLNLMPCVLPVLTIKAIGMVKAAATGHAGEIRSHGLWYTGGVLISFAVLAAAVIGIRSATGFANLGFQLQSAPTVAVLALLMFVIGLWLIGHVEFGTSVQNTGSSLASREGALGAFFTGVLAAVVGAPCVGPFLGAALGAVMGQPAPVVVLVFLAMGLGLALPFLILSFVPGLNRLLPKPGRWMEVLKQLFAFPMFLTAAWLLSVLGALAGHGVVGWTLAAAVGIVFGLWLMRQGGPAAKYAGVAVVIVSVLGAGLNAITPAGTAIASASSHADEAWSPERVEALLDEGRPVFVDFTAAWCATCQVNKARTFNTARVRDAFETHNVAFLVADFTRKDPVIADELKRRQRAGVPMYLWYPAGAREPEILPELLSPELVIGKVEGTEG